MLFYNSKKVVLYDSKAVPDSKYMVLANPTPNAHCVMLERFAKVDELLLGDQRCCSDAPIGNQRGAEVSVQGTGLARTVYLQRI